MRYLLEVTGSGSIHHGGQAQGREKKKKKNAEKPCLIVKLRRTLNVSIVQDAKRI